MFWWFMNKHRVLKRVKYELFLNPRKRSVKSSIVIHIIQTAIDDYRDEIYKSISDISFNPLNDSPLILHILENYHLLEPYPEHRMYIKKVCVP